MDAQPDNRQQRMKEFLQILPLTAEIAGLPHAAPGIPFNADQMDVRATALRNAYKQARKLLKEISEDS